MDRRALSAPQAASTELEQTASGDYRDKDRNGLGKAIEAVFRKAYGKEEKGKGVSPLALFARLGLV